MFLLKKGKIMEKKKNEGTTTNEVIIILKDAYTAQKNVGMQWPP